MPALPPPPTRSPMYLEDGNMSQSWTSWLTNVHDQVKGVNVSNSAYDDFTAVENFNYQFTGDVQTLILLGANVNGGAATLPANPVKGQIIRISPSVAVLAFKLLPSPGQSVSGGPNSLVPGVVIAYTFRAENKTWYPT